ncbi:nitrile hydratase subunit beta [Epibacterium ulvae]|uniref:SH3-like domain-containing protein n=1 Tax=Epibacterium ulvae TaxID=1156985 RepID=UPI001BFC2056|nr:SH3-like domain-containing protein [Epibacterium ulvae]MBT8155201.1 nitrile hydratase subunit beta [Epibacterium ulvae]
MISSITRHASNAKFADGHSVQVIKDESLGHCRTPLYVRGAVGKVVSYIGSYKNPEDLAYGGSGLPESPLYWVEFNLAELWVNYSGDPTDTLQVEVYEHWLRKLAQES